MQVTRRLRASSRTAEGARSAGLVSRLAVGIETRIAACVVPVQAPSPRLLECDEEISRLIDQQSQELDPAKRLALVQVIQRKLEEAAVRPVGGGGRAKVRSARAGLGLSEDHTTVPDSADGPRCFENLKFAASGRLPRSAAADGGRRA